MSKIQTIEDLKNEITFNSSQIQELVSKSNIDSDTAILIDQIMQLNHYSIATIIEYLENNGD